MFKFWSRQKPSEPATAPRLALAGDPSLPKRPEGPRVPIRYRGPALILTSEVEDVSSAALQDAIRRRVPDVHFDKPPAEPAKPGQRPTAIGSYPETVKAINMGRMPLICGITYIPGTNLDGMDNADFVTSCWWWPETREVVARTKAHAVTVMLGQIEEAPAKERILELGNRCGLARRERNVEAGSISLRAERGKRRDSHIVGCGCEATADSGHMETYPECLK